MRHPRNETRFKSLDKIAADPRVEKIFDEGPDGIWVWLRFPWRSESLQCSVLHEWSCKDLLESWDMGLYVADYDEAVAGGFVFEWACYQVGLPSKHDQGSLP